MKDIDYDKIRNKDDEAKIEELFGIKDDHGNPNIDADELEEAELLLLDPEKEFLDSPVNLGVHPDEFICGRCNLVAHVSQIMKTEEWGKICADCQYDLA